MAKFCTAFVYDTPDASIGDVPDFGFAKILRNVAKCASGTISVECVDATVDGTFLIALENSASACVFVVTHLTKSHACCVCLPFFGMPMIVPLMYPEPYRLGFAAGIGAVP